MTGAHPRGVPYRNHRLALLHMLSELSDERSRIDAEIELVMGRLGAMPTHERRTWWRWVMVIAMVIVGFVALAWAPNVRAAKEARAHHDVGTIQFAADLNHFAKHPGCPTVEDLVDRGYLELSQTIQDPWQAPYRLRCEGDIARVSSAGPDGEHGTHDDIYYR